ncbi:hypothetical protein ACIHDR_38795 [Nocardia sp. NPDC052278]|uniref:hypothetical protein n=1 Tax=unclassified Nocardia TaxID=2637762 RepID=UPI0036A1090A
MNWRRDCPHELEYGRADAVLDCVGSAETLALAAALDDAWKIVKLAEAGKVVPATTRFTLTEVDAAFARLHAGQVVGRAVVVPDGAARADQS